MSASSMPCFFSQVSKKCRSRCREIGGGLLTGGTERHDPHAQHAASSQTHEKGNLRERVITVVKWEGRPMDSRPSDQLAPGQPGLKV